MKTNEKPYTNQNDKVKVIIESFGEYARLTLKEGQNGTAHTMLRNLAWLCGAELPNYEIESFMAPKEIVAQKVKAFRTVNTEQSRRGEGLWKQSPFIFEYAGQIRTYKSTVDEVEHHYKKSRFDTIQKSEHGDIQ